MTTTTSFITLTPDYVYDATVVRVIDGDTVILHIEKTFTLEVDFGFHIKETIYSHKSTELNFRLYGINAPEITGVSKSEGLKSKDELVRLLSLGPIQAETYKQDKYGRWLATLLVSMPDNSVLNVNDELVKNRFAVVYMV